MTNKSSVAIISAETLSKVVMRLNFITSFLLVFYIIFTYICVRRDKNAIAKSIYRWYDKNAGLVSVCLVILIVFTWNTINVFLVYLKTKLSLSFAFTLMRKYSSLLYFYVIA